MFRQLQYFPRVHSRIRVNITRPSSIIVPNTTILPARSTNPQTVPVWDNMVGWRSASVDNLVHSADSIARRKAFAFYSAASPSSVNLGSIITTVPLTVIARVRATSFSTYPTIFHSNFGSTSGVQWRFETSGVMGVLKAFVAGTSGGIAFTANKWYTLGLTLTSTTANLFYDGRYNTSLALSQSYTHNATGLGGRTASAEPFVGDISIAAFWNGLALSTAQMLSLTADPWQLLPAYATGARASDALLGIISGALSVSHADDAAAFVGESIFDTILTAVEASDVPSLLGAVLGYGGVLGAGGADLMSALGKIRTYGTLAAGLTRDEAVALGRVWPAFYAALSSLELGSSDSTLALSSPVSTLALSDVESTLGAFPPAVISDVTMP